MLTFIFPLIAIIWIAYALWWAIACTIEQKIATPYHPIDDQWWKELKQEEMRWEAEQETKYAHAEYDTETL